MDLIGALETAQGMAERFGTTFIVWTRDQADPSSYNVNRRDDLPAFEEAGPLTTIAQFEPAHNLSDPRRHR